MAAGSSRRGVLVEHPRHKSTIAVRVRNVSKGFPGVQALRDVSFELRTGEIHGLVGANGAGKSTLIRMLSGADRPDTGEIEVMGSQVIFDDPRHQRDAGIAAIYQELTIVPGMSALSNVFLGATPTRWFVLDRAQMRARFDELASRTGLMIPPEAIAGDLSVANQQMIEIMRAIQADRSVLIMDEPTAPLGPFERKRLYGLIERLKADMVSIIFISHDLDEVLSICGRVSVMRDGKLIATRDAKDWDKTSLVASMLGDVQIQVASKGGLVERKPVLEVRDLTVPGRVSGISFTLGCGEVLGIAGLVGAGRTEVLRALAGAEPTSTGTMRLDNMPVAWPSGVSDSIGRGIVLAPEDRKRQGLVLSRSSLANLVLADMASVSRGSVIDADLRRQTGTDLALRLGFDPARLCTDALHLSGGNQQKLVLGKWLHLRPKVLLLDEPTRGIDLGAKQEIFRSIRALADAGMAVILVSSDLEEVVEHSDRVLVMARGRRIGQLDGADASVETVLKLIFSVETFVTAGAT